MARGEGQAAGRDPAAPAVQRQALELPRTLADALDRLAALDKELSRLYVYASMLADQDTRDARHQGMRQEMVQLAASSARRRRTSSRRSCGSDKATVEKFLASEPRLKIYRFYLEDIARRAAHTLSDAEEKILADAGPLSGAPSNVFNILSNADFPYPTVTLSDGRSVKVDQAGYTRFARCPIAPIARR